MKKMIGVRTKMKKYLVVITGLISVILLLAGCSSTTTELSKVAVENANFRLLLSDDLSNETAIGEFESVIVKVLGIGLRQSGGPEVLLNTTETDEYDLKDYLGPDAVPIWEGELDPGEYKGVVLYLADDVTGTFASDDEGDEENIGDTVNIKLPSGKLKLDIPFTIEPDTEGDASSIDYVFDITVFKAGDSGMYILKPVVKESGPNQEHVIHRYRTGKSEDNIEFKGMISEVTVEDTVTLGVTVGDVTYEVIVSENTKVNGIKGEFNEEDHVGLTVEVEGVLDGENVVQASKIKVKKNAEAVEAEIELEGTITAIVSSEDGLTLEVTVGDTVTYEVIVDENTKVIGIKGEFTEEEHLGLTVEVEGVLQEGNDVLASKIKVNKAKVDEEEEEVEIELEEEEIEFEGAISSIGPPLEVTVGDATYDVIVDENTKVIGLKGEFTEGLTVEVEGVLQEGNDVLASKIKVNKVEVNEEEVEEVEEE